MRQGRPEIVKTERRQTFGLCHWYVFGLNLFAYNGVVGPIDQRPDLVFLMDLTARLSCAAHVGSLALKDRVDAPEEMFGSPDGAMPYLRTRVDFYDGFYDLNTSPCFDACFFPQVTTQFWEAILRDEGDLEQMLLNHGLAFYVGTTPSALDAMQARLSLPFPGEAPWLTAVTALYPLMVTVGHDGQFFHVYARNDAAFDLLEPSLSVAEEAVEKSAWFASYRDRLFWDDNRNLCLMLTR